MIIVDRALQARAAAGNPIKVGMIGAGFMGRGIANQIINSGVQWKREVTPWRNFITSV